MIKKSLIGVVILCFILVVGFVSAQETKINIPPLYKYLQNNADSTIVLTYERDAVYPVVHFILSKKSDMVTLYLYESPYDRRGKDAIPKNIRNFFQKRDIEINDLKVDTNSYFNAKYVKPGKAQTLWRKTMFFHPWQLTDDTIDGEGCDKFKGDSAPVVYDGGGIKLFLITGAEIKQLYWYAPKFYAEKCIEKKKGRKAILKLEQIFRAYYGKK